MEFGELHVISPLLGLEEKVYLAMLNHSGSRGTGEDVAGRFSKLALELHPELPQEIRHLAWLDMDNDAGREYWRPCSSWGGIQPPIMN